MKTRHYFTSSGRPWVIETLEGSTWVYTYSVATKEHALLLLTRGTERAYNNETGEIVYPQEDKGSGSK